MILVDDGTLLGASMLAAVRTICATGPESTPSRSRSVSPACRELAAEADDVVRATMPAAFEAAGQVCARLIRVTDDEVRELLATPPQAQRLTRISVWCDGMVRDAWSRV